jgi:integrase
MPRRSPKNRGLPTRMHQKHGSYYHVSTSQPRVWTKLASDLGSSLKLWADIEARAIPSDQTTFTAIATMYKAQEVIQKRERTQRDYLKHLEMLELVFGHMDLKAIRPADVHQYIQARGQKSKVQANREKAVLSAMFNFARRLGLVDVSNPCAGIRGHTEKARSRYVSDDEYKAVYDLVPPYIQDVLDLALITGQRPADVLKIDLADITSEALHISQNKTGAKLRIARKGLFDEVISRIIERPRLGSQLLVNRKGSALTFPQFRMQFDKARLSIGVDWQLRDLRAKAATDLEDLAHAQKLLGHRSRNTTEIYTRDRIGQLVTPSRS